MNINTNTNTIDLFDETGRLMTKFSLLDAFEHLKHRLNLDF